MKYISLIKKQNKEEQLNQFDSIEEALIYINNFRNDNILSAEILKDNKIIISMRTVK